MADSFSFDGMLKDFRSAVGQLNNKTNPFDSQAEVLRVEGDTAWVHIPGGVDETPVKLTTNAKAGDIVQIRVSGGRAWLYGNQTNPPTDDTQAIKATNVAEDAQEKASTAIDYASIAKEASDVAQGMAHRAEEYAGIAKETTDEINEYAETAGKTVTEILNDGETAGAAASIAQTSAQLAVKQLSVVEDIIGVLSLVAENGVYAITQDEEVKSNKWYFDVEGTAVTDPSGNPHEQGWYELFDDIYSLTEDVTVVSGKTYYTIVASPVVNPIDDDISTYYELVGVDKAIQNYISDHIVYVGGTLSLQNGATRVALSTDPTVGLVFYNNGQQVAQYGSDAIIGDPTSFHITIASNYQSTGKSRISFYGNDAKEVAYIDEDMLYITKTVVIQQMDVGDEDGQWSWKIHKVNGENNLYLKWLG